MIGDRPVLSLEMYGFPPTFWGCGMWDVEVILWRIGVET